MLYELKRDRKVHAIECPECKGRGLVNEGTESVDGCELCQRRGKLVVLSIPQYEAMKRTVSPQEEMDRVAKENRELRSAIKEIYTRFSIFMDPDDEPEED